MPAVSADTSAPAAIAFVLNAKVGTKNPAILPKTFTFLLLIYFNDYFNECRIRKKPTQFNETEMIFKLFVRERRELSRIDFYHARFALPIFFLANPCFAFFNFVLLRVVFGVDSHVLVGQITAIAEIGLFANAKVNGYCVLGLRYYFAGFLAVKFCRAAISENVD